MREEKPADAKGAAKRLACYFRPHHAACMAVAVLTLAGTAFSIAAPKVMGLATTELSKTLLGGTVDSQLVAHVLVVLLVLYALSATSSYLQNLLMAHLAQGVVFDLRHEIDEKLNRLPLSYFDSRSQGEVLSRVTNDMDLISSSLQDTITQTIGAVITFAGVVIMLLVISPWMTLVVLATVPVSFFATKVVAKRSRGEFAQQQKTLGDLNGHIEEMYEAHEVVKAFSLEGRSIAAFDERNKAYFEHASKARFISGIVVPIMAFIGNLGFVAVCIAGGFLAMQGAIAIGDIQASLLYMSAFPDPITHIAAIISILQSTLAASERVFEVLDEPDADEASRHASRIAAKEGVEMDGIGDSTASAVGSGHAAHRPLAVSFEDVRFSYSADHEAIRGLSAQLPAGAMVALVGPTGAGKTTLVNLLMRFYEVDSGEICVGGVPIGAVEASELRSHVGMVLQDTWLFSSSVKDNIAFGVDGATDEQVEAAAVAAHADHFIRTLPDGYDTQVNEDATNISAGEKQLLTIARAMLKDPEILVLDEATSLIDARTERLVQQAMRELFVGRTSLVIAHRLSTIRDADVILVMDGGQIVEQGTHVELLARGGLYSHMYESQFLA